MKIRIFIIVGLLISSVAFASGTTIGNGGNGIICKNSSGVVKSVEVLDYYEHRLNGGNLSLNSNLGSYESILADLFDKWLPYAPIRMAQYKKWLHDFPSEAGIYSGVVIPAIPDTGTIVIPNGCELKPIAFQRPDSEVLPGIMRYTINKDIWVLMDEVQKAGLVLHELIYREGILADHKTSFPTRYFNSYLASAQPNSYEYAGVVSQMPLLWTEYAGTVVVQIGEMKGSLGCSSCLSFVRKSTISSDGRSIQAAIIEVLGDLETENFKIKFSDYRKFELPLFLTFNGAKFSMDSRNLLKPPRGTRNILEIEVKNKFKLVFLSPVSTRTVFDENGRLSADNDSATTDTSDPLQSWVKNTDNFVIDHVTKAIDGIQINTTNGIWQWDKGSKKYIKLK